MIDWLQFSGVAKTGGKSIAAFVDDSARSCARLAIKMKIAAAFDAQATAVYAIFRPDPQTLYAMPGSAELQEAHEKERAKRAAVARR